MCGWTQEKHEDLEWFGPPERNTLRPLEYCIDCGSLDRTFYLDQGECLHCTGPRQVGPANRSLLYERYEDLPLQLLSVVLTIGKLMCVSTARIWPCAALPAQWLQPVLPNSRSRAATVGSDPSDRWRSSANPAASSPPRALLQRTPQRTCSRQSLLTRAAPWCDYTPSARAQSTVTRRLGNKRAHRGVSWADHALTWARTAHLPAFNAVVGLTSRRGPSAKGTW
jgi:hypothetical protein